MRAPGFRAIDRHDDTIEFHRSPVRTAKAAKRVLVRRLRGLRRRERPVAISTDKPGCCGPVVATLKTERTLNLDPQDPQVRPLNNIAEADHGRLKRLIGLALGFQSLNTAFASLRGLAVMRAFKKGQGALFRHRPAS